MAKFRFYIVSKDENSPEVSGTDDYRIARECAAEFVVIDTETGTTVDYSTVTSIAEIPEQTIYKLTEHRK